MTSNIKEYIQGCISVWFSYMVGNVKRIPAGQVRFFSRLRLIFRCHAFQHFCAATLIEYHVFNWLSTAFFIFFSFILLNAYDFLSFSTAVLSGEYYNITEI